MQWQKEIKEIARCYRAIFLDKKGKLTIEGRTVLRDIMTNGHYNDDVFNADPLVMAKQAAEQTFSKRIYSFIMTKAEAYEIEEDDYSEDFLSGINDLNREITDE